jgi:ABC-type lipoprotein export system ATPase subunit
MSPLVAVQCVTKSYGRGSTAVKALNSVSFEARLGELVQLTGPSGAGKTTLLNLISALDRPDRGEVLVAGANVTSLSLAEAARYRNKQVGIVFQSYNLLPQLTALENVLVPMIPNGRMDRNRAFELLDAVGVVDRSAHRPSQLSGGEQQRVAIARALANDPILVLADEPTGNLDDENARNVMALLCRTCRGRGNTLIVVTHDRDIMHTADTVFELRNGIIARVRATDTKERPGPIAEGLA